MHFETSALWLDELVLASTIARSCRTSGFYRDVRRGSYIRLAEGVFLPTKIWVSLSQDDKYLARIHAVVRASRPGLTLSHFSAAALWKLPIVGSWPTKPEVVVGSASAGVSRVAFTARKYSIPRETDSIDEIAVTPLPRTLIDIGRSAPLSVSVAMMDRALARKPPEATGLDAVLVRREDLLSERSLITSSRGRSRCAQAIMLANGLSGSPGESLSRTAMYVLGLPMPLLQHAFYDSFGLIGYVDFWWPERNLIGEFDGFGKYFREEMLAGKSPADVVIAEKRREDRLRALGHTVTRWNWDVARSLPRLDAHLREAGLGRS
jgi:hypothetical protein